MLSNICLAPISGITLDNFYTPLPPESCQPLQNTHNLCVFSVDPSAHSQVNMFWHGTELLLHMARLIPINFSLLLKLLKVSPEESRFTLTLKHQIRCECPKGLCETLCTSIVKYKSKHNKKIFRTGHTCKIFRNEFRIEILSKKKFITTYLSVLTDWYLCHIATLNGGLPVTFFMDLDKLHGNAPVHLHDYTQNSVSREPYI